MTTITCPTCKVELNVPKSTTVKKGRCVCGEVLDLSAAVTPITSISITVNGRVHIVDNVDPKLSLNSYLRSLGHTDVKHSCLEGGCGACAVLLSRGERSLSVNSCLRPLAACDGYSVTTCKGIGSQRAGFHPIQERLADGNGSQCGMCSPGHVMTMYSLLLNKPMPLQAEVEAVFDGNLCRCTGYRPILAAMKSFAVDYGAAKGPEVITATSNTGAVVCTLPRHEQAVASIQHDACPPPVAPESIGTRASGGPQWYRPRDLASLFSTLQLPGKKRLVAGNTSTGVYKKDDAAVLVDVSRVTDLHKVATDNKGVTVGAAVTINDLIDLLKANESKSSSFGPLIAHMGLVANYLVRNAGTWAGNLMMSHEHPGFQSDMYTILQAAGATLLIGTSATASTSVDLDSFITTDMTGKVILSMSIPLLPVATVFRTYKVMPRHTNAHAIINAGFSAQMNGTTVSGIPVIVYGGVGPHTIVAAQTAKFMSGKDLSDSTVVQNVIKTLQQELVPDPDQGEVEYRKSLILSVFFKFVVAALPESAVPAHVRSAAEVFERPVSDGVQSYESDPREFPMTQPLPKLASRQQASGDAQYVMDALLPATGVHAHFVTATASNATLSALDLSRAKTMPGYAAFIGAADIPASNQWMTQPVFVAIGSKVEYYGQAIGMVLADTEEHAEAAANAVMQGYDKQGAPVVSLEQAIEKGAFVGDSPSFTIGDVDKAFATADHVVKGSCVIEGQHHFYLETQVAMASVGEDNSILLNIATQAQDKVQANVAAVLGISESRVTVETRRCGGGYGGKGNNSLQIASAVAVAAWRTGVPVKCQMTLSQSLTMLGGRHPQREDYTVGFNKDGTVVGLELVRYCDNGAYSQVSSYYPVYVDNCYRIPNWKASGKMVKTNRPSTTFTRAPEAFQGSFFAEAVMHTVAETLDMDPADVKVKNCFVKGDKTVSGQTLAHCDIKGLIAQLRASSDYDRRVQAAKQFNAANVWRKRGVALTTERYPLGYPNRPALARVNIMHGDGTISLAHGCIELGQGAHTRIAQAAAMELGVPLSNIVVKPTTTELPNVTPTGGSTSTEVFVLACLDACKTLNARLAPIRRLVETISDAPPSWSQLISKAYAAGVDLSAEGYSGNQQKDYQSWGVMVTEAEIDVLTGEVQILRADVLLDCGKSMNPMLDIGQTEGAVVMGLGNMLTESIQYSPDGVPLTDSTWTYKPFGARDVPLDFRVALLKGVPNSNGVLGSKAVGEPPLCLSPSVLFAVKAAVASARSDAKLTGAFDMSAPATTAVIQQLCKVDAGRLVLQ